MYIETFSCSGLGFRGEAQIRELGIVNRVKTYDKGSLVVSQGEWQSSVPFVVKGIMRGYYIDAE